MDTPIADQLAALRTENDRLKAWARDVVAALGKARAQASVDAPDGPPVPQRQRMLPDDREGLFTTSPQQNRAPERETNRFSMTLRMAAEQYEILAFEHDQLKQAAAVKDAELTELRARVRNLRRALSAVERGGPEIPSFPLPEGPESLTGLTAQPIAE